MLIQKPIAKNDIITLKLTTGEELIATFLDQDDNVVTVNRPCSIATSGQGMGLIPWIITNSGDKVDINKNAVMAMVPTESEIAKSYTESTTNIKLS